MIPLWCEIRFEIWRQTEAFHDNCHTGTLLNVSTCSEVHTTGCSCISRLLVFLARAKITRDSHNLRDVTWLLNLLCKTEVFVGGSTWVPWNEFHEKHFLCCYIPLIMILSCKSRVSLFDQAGLRTRTTELLLSMLVILNLWLIIFD